MVPRYELDPDILPNASTISASDQGDVELRVLIFMWLFTFSFIFLSIFLLSRRAGMGVERCPYSVLYEILRKVIKPNLRKP